MLRVLHTVGHYIHLPYWDFFYLFEVFYHLLWLFEFSEEFE